MNTKTCAKCGDRRDASTYCVNDHCEMCHYRYCSQDAAHQVLPSLLNVEQRKAADKLKSTRPATVPGTRAVINRKDCLAWWNKVNKSADKLGINLPGTPALLQAEFFDIAGVAD